jgi:S-formylglutathione hydrolase FrmB
MRRVVAALLLLSSTASPARGQVFDWVNLDRVNGKLGGRVIDFTHNHGADRRICSPILGMLRDLYVYLPPNYDPSIAYPLVIYLHGAHIDEHAFLDPGVLKKLDRMISQGEVPAAIIAAPDGTYEGKNRITCTHSLWVNGLGGRFEDHVVDEILPFLMRTYSIRPEREGHALLGISAGGFGAMTIALKHRDVFGAVATVGGPLNVRYDNKQGRYADDFDPATYRERTVYDPDMIIAHYYLGIVRRRAKTFFEGVYGTGPEVSAKVFRDNPADLLALTDLRPGELAMYVNHPDRDNYNFDAQDRSFAWLAARRGLKVDLTETPGAQHDLGYIQRAEPPACFWLGRHILPPARRQILAKVAAGPEPEATRTRFAVSSSPLSVRD